MTVLDGIRTVTGHIGYPPSWDCEACGEPWPCPNFQTIPPDRLTTSTLIPVMAFLLSRAIKDLRGRPEGPEPPEIVQRFVWFLPLSDDEARAIALRLR
ncbi:hypothetical protein [Micromonospora sp. KC723]|uniref:hypothetical protein n=1 Tax=Micromonospora sp. KC723 TaxID=2530381 RepID=UPI001FB84F89|nr:hypothetical protein [Micromonospora sp. KC723]